MFLPGNVFRQVQKAHNLPPGDFPDLNTFKANLRDFKFSNFSKLKPKMIQDLDTVTGIAIRYRMV